MPNNAKKSVYKEKEFQMYLLWKSLPAHFRGMKKTELESSGFSDPLILKIIKIKSQTEFAKHFKIKDLGTLTDWNHKIKKDGITSPLLETNFNMEHSSIHEKIILPTIDDLKKKSLEKDKVISLLEKENASLRAKLEKHSYSKPRSTVGLIKNTNIGMVNEREPDLDLPEPKKDKNLFQKIRRVFLNKK